MTSINLEPRLILLATNRAALQFIEQRGLDRKLVLVPLEVEQLAGLGDVELYAHSTLWDMPDGYRMAQYVADRIRAAERLPRGREPGAGRPGLVVNYKHPRKGYTP